MTWRPHGARDAELADLRERVRRDLDGLVATYRLGDPDRLALVVWWTVLLADMFARHTREMEDAVVEALVLERHRRQREAMPDPWRGR